MNSYEKWRYAEAEHNQRDQLLPSASPAALPSVTPGNLERGLANNKTVMAVPAQRSVAARQWAMQAMLIK